ncbi:MAG: Zn-ribbon domain-containing OB-fold protein [Tepidisphaeraceae bacterium]
MSEYRKLLPDPTAESAPFWAACRERALRIQRCDRCGLFAFPPAARCPKCLSVELTWTTLSGRGQVHSFVIYRRAYHAAFEAELPYLVALVELDEGPRLISNIVGCDATAVRCDLPVEVVFEQVTDTVTLYKFKPLNVGRST